MADQTESIPNEPAPAEAGAGVYGPDLPTAINNSVYNYFDPIDDVVLGGKQTVTEGFFTGNDGEINTFFTSSTQAELSSSCYYIDVYQSDPSGAGAEVQFDVAYGYYGGIDGNANEESYAAIYSASDAVYKQYASILLPKGVDRFQFAGGEETEGVSVINLKRDKLKEGLEAGHWELALGNLTAVTSLIDESLQSSPTVVAVGPGVGRAYYIVSGSGAVMTGSAIEFPYGIAYPDLGILVLNNQQIDDGVGSPSPDWSTSNNHDNNLIIYDLIDSGSSFVARNEEEISSTHYFVRAKNKRYNFSNNNTWVTGSAGVLKYEDMWPDPKVYITTVGLYNDNNELLATAKLSKPVQKSFDRELLIKVRLDY